MSIFAKGTRVRSMRRRRFLSCLPAAVAATTSAIGTGIADAAWPAEIRVGLTPVFLDDQLDFLKKFRGYLSERLEKPVRFFQRGSYREIIDLIRTEKIDFAWLCGYPYVRFRHDMRLLAVPLYHGNPLYQSYLIVPRDDTRTTSLLDLRGRIFAYSDPDSNSGYLVPRYQLLRLGQDASSFFSRSFFTWGHRKVIEAVGIGLAHGGAVDGYVWDTLKKVHPDLTDETRIVSRSPELGYPPFVARAKVPDELFHRMQALLLTMPNDAPGAALLKTLNLDGFVAGSDRLFDEIATMARTVEKARK